MLVGEGKGGVSGVKGPKQAFGQGEDPIDLLPAFFGAISAPSPYFRGPACKTVALPGRFWGGDESFTWLKLCGTSLHGDSPTMGDC